MNLRIIDGLKGLRQTVTDIIEADVDLVIHGGDLFHRSAPGVGEIAFARQQLERFAAAGIPVIGATGNHDFATDRGKSSATAAVHDPGRNIHMVTGDSELFQPADGVNIHVVSHAGLIGVERAVPAPIPGELNVFATHGAAQVPGSEVFTCVDSPGEAVVGFDLLSADWQITLLGHYHKQGPLPGFNSGRGQVWYAGSLLRRGFSDPPGGRGWLLVELDSHGNASIAPQHVAQRAQHDLPVVDAAGLSGSEVEELVREHLTQIDLEAAPILRQRVINCPVSTRRGVDIKGLKDATGNALVWQLEFFRPPLADIIIDGEDNDEASESLTTARSADLPTVWNSWYPTYAGGEHAHVPENIRESVRLAGELLLAEVSANLDTHTDALTVAPATAVMVDASTAEEDSEAEGAA